MLELRGAECTGVLRTRIGTQSASDSNVYSGSIAWKIREARGTLSHLRWRMKLGSVVQREGWWEQGVAFREWEWAPIYYNCHSYPLATGDGLVDSYSYAGWPSLVWTLIEMNECDLFTPQVTNQWCNSFRYKHSSSHGNCLSRFSYLSIRINIRDLHVFNSLLISVKPINSICLK